MPKKTRPYGTQRLFPPIYKVTYFRNDGTKYVAFGSNSNPYIDRRIGAKSTIIDQIGKDGRFRPVTHTRESYSVVNLASLMTFQEAYYTPLYPDSDKYATAEYCLAGVHSRVYSQFTSAVSSTSGSLGTVPWNVLAASAMQAMLPSFHTSNSLVNFILELKDFRDIAKYLCSGFGRKIERMDTFRIRAKDGTYRNLEGVLDRTKPFRWLSRRYLEYNFGWRPLFNDVVSLLKEISGFTAKYRELVENAGKPVQKHWTSFVSGTASDEAVVYADYVGTTPNGSVYGSFNYRVRHQVVREASTGIKYNATVRMRYAIPPELLAVGGQAKAWLDLLGVSRNPAIIWNAIPFSFLVDWVVNVGKYLDRLRLDNIQFKTEITDFCHSAKLVKRVRLDLSTNTRSASGVYTFRPWQTVDTCEISTYERKVGLPDLTLAIQTSGLNPREIALAGALVGSRR